jgi:NAD+ kinase
MLRRVAIFSKDRNERTRQAVEHLVNEFCSHGVIVQLFRQTGEAISECKGEPVERISEVSSMAGVTDMALSVGGDGTFLETVMRVKELGIPVAGVNTGRMGFLANIPNDEIPASVEQLIKGDFTIIKRSMLELVKPEGIFSDGEAVALNEITVQKADLSMITIHIYVNNEMLNTYWCDGLILSTATGSTAYNLSAGGPILCPDDESIIISPISPHNLTIRPIIIPGSSLLSLELEARSDEYMVTCDFRHARVSKHEKLNIRRSNITLNTVMLGGKSFYGTLRNRLMWGADRRN